MAKFKLFVDETRSFRHVIKVETDLNENQLDALIAKQIDNNKNLRNLDDITEKLKSNGLKVTKVVADNDEDLGEIEITDLEEIE